MEALLQNTKQVAQQEKAYAIKIDPDVEIDKAGDALGNLRQLGFVHKGFKEGLSKDYIQPRMTMITPIDKSDEELIKSFERRNRSKVRLALKRGTKVERAGRDQLKIFADLMRITGERDGFLTRDISYFENIYDALHPDGDAELFLVKLEPESVLKEITEENRDVEAEIEKLKQKKQDKKTLNKIKDAEAKIARNQKLIAQMEELRSKHPDGVYLSGALLMFCGKNLTIYTVHHLMIIVTSCLTIICNLQ